MSRPRTFVPDYGVVRHVRAAHPALRLARALAYWGAASLAAGLLAGYIARTLGLA